MFFQFSLALILCWLSSTQLILAIPTVATPVNRARAKISVPGRTATFEFEFFEKDPTVVKITYEGLTLGRFYPYHIHVSPASGSGTSCDAAGEHWNPTHSTLQGTCDRKNLGLCESGDLAGKHGRLLGYGVKPTVITYTDPSLKYSTSERGILGKSIVIHSTFYQTDRIACAPITAAR